MAEVQADYLRKLNSYYRCLQARKESVREKMTQIEAVTALRESEVQLNCFRCLSPEEQTEVEEVWKPNESFIGKKTRRILDKVKQFILSQVEYQGKQQRDEWNYTWEKAGFGRGTIGMWENIVDIDPSLSIVEKTMSLIKKFMKRDRRQAKLGDHFELILPRASRNDMGWYRCVRPLQRGLRIANLYYVDVLTNSTPEIIIGGSVAMQMKQMDHKFEDLKLVSHAKVTAWSECSRCGTSIGEQRRKITCHLSIAPNVSHDLLSNSEFAYMQLFSGVPCRSSLVPLKLRSILWQHEDIVQVRSCSMKCGHVKAEKTRIIMGKNEFGRDIVIDEIPPGEYRMDERLPPLRKAVKRAAIKAFENDPYILSCPQDSFGIFWALNETYISSASLLQQYPDKRIYINGDNQLIINYLKMEDDESFYSCHRAYDGDVLRTFSFVVNKSKQRQEIVEYINFVIRYGAFLLIVLLVLSVLLNTSVHSEKYRREAALRLYQNNNKNNVNHVINKAS